MKRILFSALCFAFLFSGCSNEYIEEATRTGYDAGYEDGYDAGYDNGYEAGRSDGYAAAESEYSYEYLSDEEIAEAEEAFEEYVRDYIEENY